MRHSRVIKITQRVALEFVISSLKMRAHMGADKAKAECYSGKLSESKKLKKSDRNS